MMKRLSDIVWLLSGVVWRCVTSADATRLPTVDLHVGGIARALPGGGPVGTELVVVHAGHRGRCKRNAGNVNNEISRHRKKQR